MVLTGCSAKYIRYKDVRYFSTNFLTFSDVKDVDAQIGDDRLKVGSTHVHPDANSIDAVGGVVEEVGEAYWPHKGVLNEK